MLRIFVFLRLYVLWGRDALSLFRYALLQSHGLRPWPKSRPSRAGFAGGGLREGPGKSWPFLWVLLALWRHCLRPWGGCGKIPPHAGTVDQVACLVHAGEESQIQLGSLMPAVAPAISRGHTHHQVTLHRACLRQAVAITPSGRPPVSSAQPRRHSLFMLAAF